MAKRHHHAHGHHAGMEGGRRHEEMREAGMISEDHSAIANMPQHVVMKPYPKAGPYMMDGQLNDTITGVDRQMDHDDSKRKGGMKPHKY